MVKDVVGYRDASLGDAWTENSNWSPEILDKLKRAAIGAMGNAAYARLVNAESVVKNFVTDAKVTIVIRSVIVPLTNMIANTYQLAARGVPIPNIIRGLPKKTAEIDSYVKSHLRKIDLEAELRAAESDLIASRKLSAEIQSINDAHRRLSIWPLIEAGELSSISDAGISRDEILLSEGKLSEYFERLTSKLPGPLKTAGRYALITRDTALFQGLQRSVEYGDFLAKALLYDDLTKRKGESKSEALGRISEEFVNYDRLPGRFRGTMENMGLLWFWNFKIRSVKIALSMIRHNPVHTLLVAGLPTPTVFGNVGLPIEDNLFSVWADGRIDYSVGPNQGFRAMGLNPWVNLTT